WTILIDNNPTAFRARDAEELLPTLNQLKRKNTNVVMKWFSGGQLWASPDAARDARRRPVTHEKRSAAWRPGGAHVDPRDRFKKKSRDEAAANREASPRRDDRKPWTGKPSGPPRGDRPQWSGKPSGAPRSDRPWSGKPSGPPRGDRPPWKGKPSRPPRGDRPWTDKPSGPPRG